MSIIRVSKDKKNPYLIMNKTGIDDIRLSLKAKGLLCYLLSKPDNWFVSTHDIAKNNLNSIFSIHSAIDELVKFGYMFKHQFRTEDGKYDHYNYLIYEKPEATHSNITITLPKCGFPLSVNPLSGNHTVLNNNRKKILTTTTPLLASPSLDDIKTHYTQEELKLKSNIIFLLNKLKIKNHKKIFDLFTLTDIFKYVMWILTNNFKMDNPTGFLITAIKDNWIEKNLS